MACIKVANYLDIAQYYDNSQTPLAGVSDELYAAAYEIVMLQTFDPELDLLQPFYTAYLTSQYAYSTPPASILAAVRSLQSHVLNRARTEAGAQFTDITTWLKGTGGRQDDVDTDIHDQVYAMTGFTTMSEQAGYPIDAP